MSHLVIGVCARSVSRFFTELCRNCREKGLGTKEPRCCAWSCPGSLRLLSTQRTDWLAPCQDIPVLPFFVVTAKNFSESRRFISTKGDFIMSQVVHGRWPKPLAQKQPQSPLHARSIETICRLRMNHQTYWNQAYANMKVSKLC